MHALVMLDCVCGPDRRYKFGDNSWTYPVVSAEVRTPLAVDGDLETPAL